MLFHIVCAEKDLLEENSRLAVKNRDFLSSRGIKSFDFMGAIGSGKTELIAALGKALKEKNIGVAAIVGDVAGNDDAVRLEQAGIRSISLNTGKECHLDAHLVSHALEKIKLEDVDVLFIENVGNLVCPADFPLGTNKRIVVVSVTEGDDMVRKHPHIFGLCDIAVINKVDLAEVMGVNISRIEEDFRKLRPNGTIIRTSVKTGEGIASLLSALDY